MIQMNMREEDRGHVRHPDAGTCQMFPKDGQRAGRSGIDQRDTRGAAENDGGDYPRRVLKLKVDVRDAGRKGHHVLIMNVIDRGSL